MTHLNLSKILLGLASRASNIINRDWNLREENLLQTTLDSTSLSIRRKILFFTYIYFFGSEKLLQFLNNLSFIIGFLFLSPVDDWKGLIWILLSCLFARLMNSKGLRVDFNNYLRMLAGVSRWQIKKKENCFGKMFTFRSRSNWIYKCHKKHYSRKYENIIKSMFILT